MGTVSIDGAIADELIEAFLRLARGDFSVRLKRNNTRDTADTLAFFVNLIAEELQRLLNERDRSHRELEQHVRELSEAFLALAAGNYEVRAKRSGNGDPIDVMSFLFNNTAEEIGEAVAEMERRRSVLEAILESMIDGVLLLDAHGMIKRSNAATTRLLGYPSGMLIGRWIGEILDPRESEFAAKLASEVQKEPFRDRSTEFRTASGQSFAMAVSGSTYRDAKGVYSGIVLVTRDDRQLRQAQAQLQMTDRMAAVGTVAAGVAHEINNPLAYVMSNLDFVVEELVETAEEGELSTERREEMMRALKAAQRGADRVRQIVGDLKTFSRVDRDTVRRLDVNKLVDSSVAMLKNELRHHAHLLKEYGDIPAVEANEARLGQVFLNLIQNAAQAIPEGHADGNQIRIITSTLPSGEACVEIRDTGCGIPPENLHRIFDAFFTTKPIGVGTGLGLSICHQIVTSLGGRIEVTSEVGVGSVFRVVLPAARKEREGTLTPIPKAPIAPRRLRILVLDDEVEVGEAVRRTLGKEHDVDLATRGSQALELIGKRDYDLMLCDLLMPEMTGMEVYERVAEQRPELLGRIVIMTGGAFSPGARSFLDRIANVRIEKPFDNQMLRQLVAVVTAERTRTR